MAYYLGSGKTLAYLLPMMHLLKNYEETGVLPRQLRPRACVVVPFRELAVQVLVRNLQFKNILY